MLNTYIGQKGYTLLKKDLSVDQQKQIKDDLLIRPFTGASGSYGGPTVSFPVYRESLQKIYVPHYYGVHHFGQPVQNKVTEGTDIHLPFAGVLREYQTQVVNKFIEYVTLLNKGSKGGLLELPCAWGKTASSLYILSKLQKKTIVIVHKEFLMNQWIERIAQFLPNARIGKIQGRVIDIEDKDIVLCMLQSLVLKEYPASTFDSFGFTIIDEVHHISSQTFSSALFKLVTKYMLGLSATMERKDGTTKVFKMFLGDVVHKAENKTDAIVEVRAVTYKSSDPDFNETILDYKGQPQISSMISKLCSYNRRTEFIIQTLNDYILIDNNSKKEEAVQYKLTMDNANPSCKLCGKNENYLMINTCCNVINYCLLCLDNIVEEAKVPEIVINKKTGQQKEVKRRAKCPNCMKSLVYEQHYIENPYIKPLEQVHTIIMSHNLNVLEYMYKKIVCKNYASVGYYVGGMGEEELKRSEKKQVILASYSMAQEGLDIPTLNTEFLISPKTDVVQIVGRILRAKHATTIPTIYDFVDSHDVFQRQWLKRKAYYKKQGYRIIGTNNSDSANSWTTIFTEPIGKCLIKLKK